MNNMKRLPYLLALSLPVAFPQVAGNGYPYVSWYPASTQPPAYANSQYWFSYQSPPVHSNYYSSQVLPPQSQYTNPYNWENPYVQNNYPGTCDPFDRRACQSVKTTYDQQPFSSYQGFSNWKSINVGGNTQDDSPPDYYCCGSYAVSGQLMYALSVLRGAGQTIQAIEQAQQTFVCDVNPRYRSANPDPVQSTNSFYMNVGSSNWQDIYVQPASFYCANAPMQDRSCDTEINLDCAARHGFFYCCARYSLTDYGHGYFASLYGDSSYEHTYIEKWVSHYEYTCEIDPLFYDHQEWQWYTDGIYEYTCQSNARAIGASVAGLVAAFLVLFQ